MFVKCVLNQPLPIEDLDSGAILIYCLSLVAGMSIGSNSKVCPAKIWICVLKKSKINEEMKWVYFATIFLNLKLVFRHEEKKYWIYLIFSVIIDTLESQIAGEGRKYFDAWFCSRPR